MPADVTPAWYWSKGLHDAIITKQECLFYTSHENGSYYKNCLRLHIDATHAMFDTSLLTINLYNYKILSEDFDLSGFWWIADTVQLDGPKYVLRIAVQNPKEDRIFLVRFTHCEVEHGNQDVEPCFSTAD